MCVIVASQNTKPTEEQLRAGWKANPWGAGVAWIEQTPNGLVCKWKKGIQTVEEVIKIVNEKIKEGDPYVVHFRIPTDGLEDIELTHPFPITKQAESLYEGETTDRVLFHNGGWSDWRTYCLDACKTSGWRLPEDGLLNDTRMLAWCAAHFSETWLQLRNEKVIVFGIKHGKPYFNLYGTDRQGGWNFKGDADTLKGIWFSNEKWEKELPKPEPRQITSGNSITPLRDIVANRNGGSGGNRHEPGFRPDGQPRAGSGRLPGRRANQEQVEAGQARLAEQAQQNGKSLVGNAIFRAKMAKVHNDPDTLARALHINPHKYPRRVASFLAASTPTVH